MVTILFPWTSRRGHPARTTPARATPARPLRLAQAACALLPGACALLLAGLLMLAAPPARAQSTARIVGKITGAPLKDVAGAKVVLVRFKLDAQGVPQGVPVQTQAADAQGAYEFKQVPVDLQAVYKLGAAVAHQVVSSDPFTFPEGKRLVQLDLHVPGLVSDPAGLHFKQALIALEPQVGAVWVTEVLHVGNPTANVIDVANAPLELNLPEGASHLEMMREDQEGAEHTLLGAKLLVYGRVPGNSTIAFRYRVGAALGTLRAEMRYPYPVDELLVLAPQGSVRLASEQLSPGQPRQLEGTSYDSWSGRQLQAQHAVVLRAQGIPLRQELFLIPLLGFFAVMAGVVVWFVRGRMRREPAGGPAQV